SSPSALHASNREVMMKRSFRTRAGARSRGPRRVSAVVLMATLCFPVALSAGAVSQALEARAAGLRVIRATTALSPPLQPPRLVVRQRSSSVAPGYIFIAPKLGQTAQGPEIVDGQGRPVW